MKRKIVCRTCGTSKNKATGKTLYILGEGAPMITLSRLGECWDCGEARREKEDQKKQRQLSRLMSDKDDKSL